VRSTRTINAPPLILLAKAGQLESLQIPCLGALGPVLTAKGLAVIPEARPMVDRLRQVGLDLHYGFADEALLRIVKCEAGLRSHQPHIGSSRPEGRGPPWQVPHAVRPCSNRRRRLA